jgi:hypothetical protein
MDADKPRTLYEHRDEEFYEWRAFVEAIGIDATLDELGFPRDRNANWYNVYTGSIKTIIDLITTRSMGDLVDVEQVTYQFAMVLKPPCERLFIKLPLYRRNKLSVPPFALGQLRED